MKHSIFIAAIAASLVSVPLQTIPAWAEEGHDHQNERSHDEKSGHSHDDGDIHEDHGDHGEEKEEHDNHGHGAESGGHDDHEDEHEDEHEEGVTEIAPDHAEKAGIKLSKAKSEMINESIILTGQVTLNSDTTAKVRARFPGIVRDVPVKLGQIVQQGDVLARLESNESLRSYNVTAPVSGVILERNTNIGDVTGDEALFMIADLSNVWAKFHIFPKDALYIREGQRISVHSLDHEFESEATVKLFLPKADASSQTHVAIAELRNEKGNWRPGLTIDGHVSVLQRQADITVLESALQTMENQKVVFVANGDKYEMRPVQIGQSDGKTVEIINGLKAGEDYVSEGSFIIKADILKSGAAHEH
jgi:cobalt-zinc-cadmium efflux system membrane fusion protein